jgi:succinyl-CoA synthetase beta subunit
MVQHYGGAAANFLDFGGGADAVKTSQALELLLETGPKALLINIFGGITRCDVVAQGFVRSGKVKVLTCLSPSAWLAPTKQKAGQFLKRLASKLLTP